MTTLRTLRARLFASIFLVIATVAGVGYVVVRYLTPTLFERRIQARGGTVGRGLGPGGPPDNAFSVTTQVQDTYDRALSTAAIAAALAGAVVAAIVAGLLLRALLRRIQQLEAATTRLAAGDYTVTVPRPAETELVALVDSINTLGTSLRTTEEARAQLVSDLAHELRNPLTTIEGFMEGLIDGVLPATEQTYKTVAQEASRLKRLTNDLSVLARAQESSLDLTMEPIDIAAVAAQAAARLQPQYEAKGVHLSVASMPELVVNGDTDRLAQALTNIVGNALTHTPTGGTVTITGHLENGTVRLEIADTGTGIPNEQLENIFERFTRLDPSRSGIGIGLNIARTIVQAHGGDITARSDDSGSTFKIRLPRHARSDS